MNAETAVVLLILFATVALFAADKLGPDVVALPAVLALLLTCLTKKLHILLGPTSWKGCEERPSLAILGHENSLDPLFTGPRISAIREAAHPLCTDLCLGLLPQSSLSGM